MWSGAPAEIRTPDLLLRRTSPTNNQQITRNVTNSNQVLQMSCPAMVFSDISTIGHTQ